MKFAMPLGLLGLIGIPILIIIYMLKRRYVEETVPSTFLWKRSLKYMKHRFPFNLRNSLLLLCQILAIVSASFMMADPQVQTEKNEVVAIIDGSASMMALDDTGTSRFDRAKEMVLELADEAGENGYVTVICAGSSARQYVYRSNVPGQIREAVERCTCSWGLPDVNGALGYARDVQEKNTAAEIRFYTDTVYEDVDGIEIVDVTASEQNVAALSLSATEKSGKWQFTGELVSYGGDATVNAVLYVDGQKASVQRVDLTDGERQTVTFREYDALTYIFAEMRIVPEEGEDALEKDNSVTCNYAASLNKLAQVAFAPGFQDQFLDSALRSVKRINVATVTQENAKDSGYDLYVYIGYIPDMIPNDGSVWFVNPPTTYENEEGTQIPVTFPEGIDITLGSTFTADENDFYRLRSTFSTVAPFDAIQSGLSLTEVAVKQATKIESETFEPLLAIRVGNEDYPVLSAGIVNYQRFAVMTLGLSDLSTNMADYVLLISNMVRYSCPDILSGTDFTVGESAQITMPAGATQITVERNGDTVTVLEAGDTFYTFEDSGSYKMVIDLNREGSPISAITVRCSVNIPEEDSDLYSRQDVLSAQPLTDEAAVEYLPVAIWHYFLIALLLLLMAEWWVYYRV